MLLQVYANKTVKEVKEAFQQAFPYLKIEFFSAPHKRGEGSFFEKKIDNKAYLIDVTGVMKEGVVHIASDTTVAALEEQFQNQLGLPIQVFRKSSGVWLETTETDNLTLQEQNEMGQQASLRAA